MTIPTAELRDTVECCLALVGLPYSWADRATSEELRVLVSTAGLALALRSAEVAWIEAGAWPDDLPAVRFDP